MSMTPEQLSAMRRIKKCLALSGSSNQHEAEAAMRQAKALMKKFGLSESHVAMADITEVGAKSRSGTKMQSWEGWLASQISKSFGCQALFEHGQFTAAGGRTRGRLIFVGPECRATVAAYAFEALLRQLRQASAQYRSQFFRAPGQRSMQVFAEMWAVGALEKVKMLAEPFTDGDLIERYMAERHAGITAAKAKKASLSDDRKLSSSEYRAALAGRDAGEKVVLNAGMGRDGEQAMLLGGAS